MFAGKNQSKFGVVGWWVTKEGDLRNAKCAAIRTTGRVTTKWSIVVVFIIGWVSFFGFHWYCSV